MRGTCRVFFACTPVVLADCPWRARFTYRMNNAELLGGVTLEFRASRISGLPDFGSSGFRAMFDRLQLNAKRGFSNRPPVAGIAQTYE